MVEVFRAIIVEHTVCPCINFSGQLAICTVTSFTTKTSKVWNRVYMIAPVKKFGRVKLSTNFPSKQMCSVLSFPAFKHQEEVS